MSQQTRTPEAPSTMPRLPEAAAVALAERRNNWRIEVDQDLETKLWSVYLRLDQRIIEEGAAKLMAAHFAKALGLDSMLVHIR